MCGGQRHPETGHCLTPKNRPAQNSSPATGENLRSHGRVATDILDSDPVGGAMRQTPGDGGRGAQNSFFDPSFLLLSFIEDLSFSVMFNLQDYPRLCIVLL